MHNRPINNETDIIRNIFSKSLNEESIPKLTANSIIQQMKDIGLFGDQKKTEPSVQSTTSPTAPQVTKPTTQPKPEPAVTQPKREPIMITKMNASRDYELVPADLSKDEDLLRIQPGSASYEQLTPAEKARRESLANPSGARNEMPPSPAGARNEMPPSPSSQTTTGRGRAPSRPQPAPQPVTYGGKTYKTEQEANTAAYMKAQAALDAAARARGEMPPSAARQGWTPETWAAAERQSAELRNRLKATAQPTATTQTATEKPWEQMTPQERFQRGEQIRAQRDVPEMEERARILNIQDPRARRAAMDRYRAQQIKENYYNILSERLEQLEEGKKRPSSTQLERGEARARSMGFNSGSGIGNVNVAGIRPERLVPHLKSIISSGGGERQYKNESQERSGTKERPHIDDVVEPHIKTLLAAADKAKIDLSHGEAFDPSSKDHRRLLATKNSEVMKASEAIQKIRKEYGIN